MNKMRVSIYEFLICLSNSQDLIEPRLTNHHQQVAYLTYNLCDVMGLSVEEKKEAVTAALIHDIGALSSSEKLEILEQEPITVNSHAFKGAKLIEGFAPLKNASEIIRYHHIPWQNGDGLVYKDKEVPFSSHVLNISDKVSFMLYKSPDVLLKIPKIIDIIKKGAGALFSHDLVEALGYLAEKEYIWLDLVSQSPIEKIADIGLNNMLPLSINEITEIAFILSHIIDFRSNFTARHSSGVAVTAEKLASLIGFSPYDCQMMLIAGYLHDLGKLAISNSILEKPGKLNDNEYKQIRTHTYYTYNLLSSINQFQTINEWASFHHEKLDGKGYPFRIKGERLSLGSRIMAVADVFTAITENRPYRLGMTKEETERILLNLVKSNAIDGGVVDILLQNFEEINRTRILAQKEAKKHYEKFLLEK